MTGLPTLLGSREGAGAGYDADQGAGAILA